MTISDSADPAPRPPTMAMLRAATWPAHQRLEKGLDAKARFSDLHAYLGYLQRMWGFCAALEAQLTAASFGGALPDYPERCKRPLLARDLAALGASVTDASCPPLCPSVPAISTPAAAFGCAYVFEGATLGGRVLLPLVGQRLGLDAGHGAAFLASYGDAVTAMWLKFSAALNKFCDSPERRSDALDAATATFDRLADWLQRERP